MEKKKKGSEAGNDRATAELLKDLLIVELGRASVPELEYDERLLAGTFIASVAS